MSLFYAKDGRQLTYREWGMLLADKSYQRCWSETVGRFHVSTVWLGMDHSFGEGPPLIFETMVFESGGDDVLYGRYATIWDAEEGHLAALREAHEVTA